MELKLDTVVLRIKRPVKEAAGQPPSFPPAFPGAEMAAAVDDAGDVKLQVTSENMQLSPGEKGEVEAEDDVVGTVLSMPLSLIKPTNFDAQPTDTGGDSWGIADIGADALDQNAGKGVTVAVLDTGIDIDHPAFDPIRAGITFKDFTTAAKPNAYDDNGHGSHCAGTIFGQDVTGRRIGIARGVRNILIGKVLGQGGGRNDQIFNAIVWAWNNKASVVSMSLGVDFTAFREELVTNFSVHPLVATSMALQGYRENLRLFDKISGLFSTIRELPAPLLIAASGNESNRPQWTLPVAPPAEAADILSVGAYDISHQIAGFSNTNPDCCGPGVNILSVAANTAQGLRGLNGTSMATPHVAGAAVLAAERLMKRDNITSDHDRTFTAHDLKNELMSRAQALPTISRADGGVGQVQAAP